MAYSTSALRQLPIEDQLIEVRAGRARVDQLGPNARVIYDAGGISTALPTAAAVAASQAAAHAASAAPPPQGTTGSTGPTGGPSGTPRPGPTTGAGGPTGVFTPPKPSVPQTKSPTAGFPKTGNQVKTNNAWEYTRQTFNQTLPGYMSDLRTLSTRPVRGA